MTRVAVAAMALATLAGLLYTLNRIDEVAVAPPAVDNHLPRYTLGQAKLVRYDASGQPSMRATADSIEYFDDESAVASVLKLDVLSGTKTPWHLEAPTGRLAPGSPVLTLSGDVLAQGQWPDNGEAVTVQTPTLTVDSDQHQLSTDAPVIADSLTRRGTGTGMSANWERQDLRLLNNVKMRYDLSR